MSNVPKLRFKEFKDKWLNRTLSDVADFLDGRRKPIKESERAKMRGGYPYYGASGIIDYVNDFLFDEEIILLGEDGENIISRNLPLAFKVVGKCWVNNHAHVIKPNKATDIDFLTHSLERTNYEKYNTGTAQPKLNQEVCRNIRFYFPSLPEQQKIASFLSAVDEKIQQLTRKKELLEQYKKGVMQQLFQSESGLAGFEDEQDAQDKEILKIQKSGKSRFRQDNGKPYPKWEEKRLNDLAEIVGGGTPETSVAEYWDGPIQWFTPTEINQRFVSNSKRTITEEGLKNSSAKLLPIGTLLFTSRATIGEISFATVECTTNQGFQSLIVNKANSSEYIYYWIKQNTKEFLRRSQGSTFPEISKNEIIKIRAKVPCLEEQQKIASFLTALDAKIEGVAAQIAHTQTFKKGLLQQMFV